MAVMAEKIRRVILRNNIFITLIFFYFIFRFINLTAVPIFNDEAIYLDWGWKSLHVPNQLFLSLTDAKQPLLIWIFGISQMFFSDPLFAGRFISVIAGFITFLGIYTIGSEFFNKKIAYVACILYIVIPIFSFFDRQALMESAVSAIGIWSCYLFLKLFQTQKIYYGKLLGIVLGLGFLLKTNSLFFFFTTVLLGIYILFIIKRKKEFIRIGVWGFCFMIAISSIVLVQPLFWDTVSSNDRYSLTFSEILNFPFSLWFLTAKHILEIIFWYMTPFCFVLGAFGVLLLIRENDVNKKLIAWWLLLPVFFLVLFARNIQPRYMVSFLPLFSICVSVAFFELLNKQKLSALIMGVAGFGFMIYVTGLQIFSPLLYFSYYQVVTKFSYKDEYVTLWPSGYGIKESRDILLTSANDKKIYVGVRPDSGNPESAMFAYFNESKTIRPTYINVDTIKPWIKNELCISTNLPMYFVSRDNQMAGLENYIEKEMAVFYKPERKSYIGVYKIKTCPNQVKKI